MEVKESVSKYTFVPQGNNVLVEIKFIAPAIVYTDEKQFQNMGAESIEVVGIGGACSNPDLKIGDIVHIDITSNTRRPIPDQYINSNKPTIKEVIDMIRDRAQKEGIAAIQGSYPSYAWFIVKEFDIIGRIVESETLN